MVVMCSGARLCRLDGAVVVGRALLPLSKPGNGHRPTGAGARLRSARAKTPQTPGSRIAGCEIAIWFQPSSGQ
jgi:hypothetical protein